MDKFIIGSVTSVRGTTVKAKINQNLYQNTYFHDGAIYRGISINEFVIIKKGYQDIVGKIEGEEIIENFNLDKNILEQKRFERFVEIKILGYFFEDEFYSGIKYLPMINDGLCLISDDKIAKIYEYGNTKSKNSIVIGKSLLEHINIQMPINGTYNSHIGIFGNTGSGKSNTLAKLYISLFEKMINNDEFQKRSSFLFIDFNGEYTNIKEQFEESCRYIELRTRGMEGDKLKISDDEFWDDELLSVLFSATEKTQKPFLTHLTKNKKLYDDKLSDYLKSTINIMFSSNQHKETVTLLKSLAPYIADDQVDKVISELSFFSWHSTQEKYYLINKANTYIDTPETAIAALPTTYSLNLNNISVFDELIIRTTLQLINSVSKNYVQYEHISPLLSKITAMGNSLSKVLELVKNQDKDTSKNITVISLRNCNQDIKKAIPMMLAKCSFLEHKNKDTNTSSFHFIIDEAHNILSESSNRESESWKDYRLELFEEIIKEGRKFGFFVTISSQRPSDISPTIISQLHNYLIHRLVNENDLFLLKNSISTLDSSSRSLIPTLPPGACILSGTAFHTPALIQIDQLIAVKAPVSETIDLESLWNIAKDIKDEESE